MKKLVIDPKFGMSGDMLSAALIDLGADQRQMLSAMEKAGSVIGQTGVGVSRISRLGTGGSILEITLSGKEPEIDAIELYTHLEEVLVSLGVKDKYYDFALRSLDILNHAEYEAHRAHKNHKEGDTDELHNVHLHEAKDIIIDIVGASIGLSILNIDIENVLCLSPVMVGGGKVRFSHGETDVPAPAAASIIRSYEIPVQPGPVNRELFTPTGASILASLNPQFERREDFAGFKKKQPQAGVGFGTIDLTSGGMANALFVYATDESA